MVAASFFPPKTSVKFNNTGQIIVDFVLTADQIWAKNLFYLTAFGAGASMAVFGIAIIGIGFTDKSYPQKTSFAFRFFEGLGYLGGAGFALNFIGHLYANYRFHKI